MYNATLSVQVVKADQNLFGHSANQRQRNPLIVVPFHDFEQIYAQNLKNHHKVLAVGTRVQKAIQKLHCVAICDIVTTPFFIIHIFFLVVVHSADPVSIVSIFGDNIQNFDLIIGGLLIVTRTLLHLHGNVGVVFAIASKPHRRKVTPAQLLHHNVPIDHNFAQVHWVIAANLVVRDSFIFALIRICVELLLRNVFF